MRSFSMFFNFKNGALSCVTENDAKQAIKAVADSPAVLGNLRLQTHETPRR